MEKTKKELNLNYNQLPKDIISPITGEKLYLLPLGFPNEIDGFNIKNHVITDYDGISNPGNWLDGPVAMYSADSKNWGRSERIYVPIN